MAGPGVRISLPDLRQALSLVLDAVESQHGPEVGVEQDLYFTLGLPQMFASVPPAEDEFATCQLADDVMEMETMLLRNRSGHPLTPWHDLQHLVGVLSALAEADLPSRLRNEK